MIKIFLVLLCGRMNNLFKRRDFLTIRLKEGNAKFLRLKSDLQKDFAVAGYLLSRSSMVLFFPT
jgi:hypothetical protein